MLRKSIFEIVENKIYIGKKTTFEKKLNKKIVLYICKMYKLYNVVENQDLYRNKDDLRFF